MYSQRLTTQRRGAVVIMIDQSRSMNTEVEYRGVLMSKAEVAAIATNLLIDELLLRCCRFGEWDNLLDICVVGYSGNDVVPLIANRLEFVPLVDILKRKVTIENRMERRLLPDGTTTIYTVARKMWITPRGEGATPMRGAFESVVRLVRRWSRRKENGDSFPPILFNITDGHFTDGSPEEMVAAAESLKALGTTDGGALLFNVCYATPDEVAKSRSLAIPAINEPLPDVAGIEMLYRMSSEIPEELLIKMCGTVEPHLRPPFRGLFYNASPEEIIHILTVGTTSIVFR